MPASRATNYLDADALKRFGGFLGAGNRQKAEEKRQAEKGGNRWFPRSDRFGPLADAMRPAQPT